MANISNGKAKNSFKLNFVTQKVNLMTMEGTC